MPHPFDKLLPLMEGMDNVLSELVPAGSHNVTAVQFGDVVVFRIAPFRAFENLVLARKTFTSIYVLARDTHDNGRDHSEAVSALVRRMIDLTAQTMWLTDYDSPAAFAPVEPGNPDQLLEEGDVAAWPDDDERHGFACAVSAASDWSDVQTLRSLLYDLNEQIDTAARQEAAVEGERKTKLSRSTAMLRDQDRMIRQRLKVLKAKQRLRPSAGQILEDKASDLLFFWRVESDVLHSGTAGRVLQRKTGEAPAIGIPAQPWRHAQLLTLALDCMQKIARRVFALIDLDDSALREFIESMAEIVAQVQEEYPPQ